MVGAGRATCAVPKSHRWLGALHRDKKTHLPFKAGLGEDLVFISTAAVSQGSEQSQGWRGCALWARIEKWGDCRATNSPMSPAPVGPLLRQGTPLTPVLQQKSASVFQLVVNFCFGGGKKKNIFKKAHSISLFLLFVFLVFSLFLLPFINLRSALSWLLKPILVVSNRGRQQSIAHNHFPRFLTLRDALFCTSQTAKLSVDEGRLKKDSVLLPSCCFSTVMVIPINWLGLSRI